MDTKWTPGPWVAFFEAEQCGATPKDHSKGDVAHCAGFDTRRRTEEADANAHLIAAAPDLYAALEALRHAVCGETGFAACVRVDTGKAYPWPALDEAEALVNAALAKARGEA